MSRFVGSCANPIHQAHTYVDDGTTDHRGHGRCGTCSLPKSNRVHVLPKRSDEEVAAEARRMGEST